MAEDNGSFQGDQINLSGTFQGSVYVKSTINGAVSSTTSIGASPYQQDGIRAALERLGDLLQRLPEHQAPLGAKVADAAREVVEVGAKDSDRSMFEGCADTLKTWAERVSATLPAVSAAAQAVVTLVAKARGWL